MIPETDRIYHQLVHNFLQKICAAQALIDLASRNPNKPLNDSETVAQAYLRMKCEITDFIESNKGLDKIELYLSIYDPSLSRISCMMAEPHLRDFFDQLDLPDEYKLHDPKPKRRNIYYD